MADIVSSMIGIDDLNDLIQNQYRVFAWLDDRPELREEEPSIFPEENTRYIDIDDHPWSYSLLPREIEFTCRETGKTVILNRRQRSPFEFSTRSLLRFLLTKYEEARFNEIVIDNWIVKQVPSGRIRRSDYTPDFFAIH